MDEEDILETRIVEKTEPVCNKVHMGEKKSRGRKSNQVRIALAGSAKGQSKMIVAKGVTLPKGQ